MGHAHTDSAAFEPLSIAILTVSDSRNEADDRSGAYLVDALQTAGHRFAEKLIVPDCRYRIRAEVSRWIADPQVDVVICTGGTGLTGRDITPEALAPLYDKAIEGFGEYFRALSREEIGTSTIQSRAVAGLANGTLLFALPGSTGACRTGWTGILEAQLDIRTRPCNFAEMRGRFLER